MIPPNMECSECGQWYWSFKGHTHCAVLQEEIDRLQRRLDGAHATIDRIVLAHRERGECTQELMRAAYEAGLSTKPDEFVWLDDLIDHIEEEEQG